MHVKCENGFSLLEMMISLAVFLVIGGAVIATMANAQQGYRSSELRVGLEQNLRAAVELMTQEISQAGLQPSGIDADGLGIPLATVSASACSGTPLTCITGNTTAQWVPVSTVAGLYVWEYIRIGAGPGPDCYNPPPSSTTTECEYVQITGINSSTSPPQIQAIVQKNHTSTNSSLYPVPIYGLGTYPQGVLPPGTTQSGGSTSSQLELFGDLTGGGNSLLLVKYACPTVAGGSFTRTLYTVGPSSTTQISSVNLIDNVAVQNNVIQCWFTYPPTANWPSVSVPSCSGNSTEQVITSVGVTITANSKMADPKTGQIVSVTKSFLNIQPRNVISALNAASGTVANELQSNPNPSQNANGCQGLP
jgi:prepilin-type N-terminal cleavage/methylation domain-containing protein